MKVSYPDTQNCDTQHNGLCYHKYNVSDYKMIRIDTLEYVNSQFNISLHNSDVAYGEVTRLNKDFTLYINLIQISKQ